MNADEIRTAIADAEACNDWDRVRELEEMLVDLKLEGKA